MPRDQWVPEVNREKRAHKEPWVSVDHPVLQAPLVQRVFEDQQVLWVLPELRVPRVRPVRSVFVVKRVRREPRVLLVLPVSKDLAVNEAPRVLRVLSV